jgi:hypothetical protein
MDLSYYHGEHSVIFGDKHSWKDWHLIPSSPPVVPPPKLRENYVDIPGTNGSIDISEILTGFPTYDKRSGSMSFIYLPEFGSSRKMYETIMNYIHGKRMKVILTDEPEYFYEGRITVKEYSIAAQYSGFSFDYIFDPYKLQTHVSPGYTNLTVNEERVIPLSIGTSPMRLTPMVTVDSNMTAVYEQPGALPVSIQLFQGSYRYPGLTIGPGGGTLTVQGNGTISLDVRGGSL